MNITQIIASQVKSRPDAIAISTPEITLSYRQLEDLVIQSATYLYQNGVRSSNVIAHRFHNELNALIAFLSCAKIGATVFSTSVNTPGIMLEKSLDIVHATVIVTDETSFKNDKHEIIVFEYSRNLDNHLGDEESIIETEPTSPLLIISGSGTTGNSKYIPLTHTQMYERLKLDSECYDLESSDVMASMVHFDYYVGKLRLFGMMATGGVYCLLPKSIRFELSWIERFKITVLQGSVFHFEQILKNKAPKEKISFPSLKILGISMSTVSESLRKRLFETFGVPLHIIYGTNECSALSVLKLHEHSDPMSVGRILNGVELEIVDTHNKPVISGNIGQIRTRSASMIDGYYNDQKSTDAAFRDGWFYPGDLGCFSENGELIYCGRSDHMMVMNGINIYPAEIEAIMITHREVIDAAAMPIHHPIHQDIPVCAVVVRNESAVSRKTFMEFIYQRLGPRSPRELVILDAIPRNENGKLLRNELSQQIDQQLASQKNRAKMPIVEPKQFTRMYTINFVVPSVINFVHLDKWLKLLEIDTIAFNQTFKTQNHALLWRVMVLIKTLLQYSNIPNFYTGEILKLTSNTSDATKLTAVIRIAHIEYIPQNCYTIVLDGAFNAIMWMHNNPITTETTAQLYKNMHLKIINEISKNIPYGQSTIPLLREAYLHNIPYFHLGRGVYQLGLGAKSRKIDRSTTDGDSAMGSKLSHNKAVTANVMRMAGLPAPQHGIAKSLEDALKIAEKLGWPLVIKPSDLDRGEGVKVNIKSTQALEDAFSIARKLSKNKQVIVERQVEGICHRLFVAQGRLLYGVKRLPKSLRADGVHTIDQLITLENEAEDQKAPWKRKESFPRDADTIQVLKTAEYSLESIPKSGEWIALRDIESTRWGGRDEEVTDQIHPDNIDIAIRAAALFELDVAGVDIISSDISIPWYQNGAIINEINFSPLLGGGEISKSHIPVLLSSLIDGNGRIPIEGFVGDDRAMDAALQRQKELIDRGIKCFVTSDTETFNEQQFLMQLSDTGLNYRAKALIHNKQVEALLVVVMTDEILRDEFVLGTFDSLKICSQSVLSTKAPYEKVSTHYFIGTKVL